MHESSTPPAPRRLPRQLQSGIAIAVASCAFSAAPLGAQRVVPTLDVGGTQVRYADSITSSAATLTPAIRAEWDRATLGAAGTFSQFSAGWSSQGSLGVSLYSPSAGPLTGELAGTAGGSAHEDGSRTGQTLVLARAHLMGSSRGAWIGGGAGTTWDGGVWRDVLVGELAAWSYLGPATVLATFTPTRVADTLRYADAELAMHWELARAEVGLTGGLRSGDRLPTAGGSADAWGSLSASAWLSPRVALVASGGTYPVDFTQGFPGGRFASLGVRFGPRAARRADRADSRAESTVGVSAAMDRTASTPGKGVLDFRLLDVGEDGRRALRVHAPAATSVEVAGDFTDWRPQPLVRAGGGWWVTTVAIAPGTHEMNLRLDGAGWTVPPGLTTLEDEFGGVVGVLTVP